jgi:hypothetical protein
VIEALGMLISVVVSEGLFFGFSVGTRVDISHLLFACDTLIFCDADPNQLCNLWGLFLLFEAVLGLKKNLVKSELVLVGYVDNVAELTWIFVVGLDPFLLSISIFL